MARRVNNRESFVRQLLKLRHRPEAERPRLLSFFLFDERESQRAIESFVDAQYSWLDSLARSSNIIIFFFSRNDKEAVSENPSLEVAAKFGIKPDELPGIVFFREFDLQAEQAEGIYWRIPLKTFGEDRAVLEEAIAHLFGLIQEARKKSSDARSMFDELKAELAHMQRVRSNSWFLKLLGKGLVRVVRYPGVLVDALVTAFGKGYGEALAAKYT